MTNFNYSKEFCSHDATFLAENFRSKKLSIVEYISNLFSYIEQENPSLNALTSLQKEAALQRAKELEHRPAQSHEILFGVPIVLKENIQKKGFPVQCASRMLEGYKGQYDATVVSLLENAGAIFISTANMDEFAMGSSNEHSCHGPVKNPHHFKHSPGGSSGGSAAACAAGFAPLALGSDTGGSVREPAAFCGIYGFKPTYGRISRYGLVAFGSSLDQISPFARSISDLDIIMRILGQPDVRDATSLCTSYESQLGKENFLKGRTIGVPRSLLTNAVDKRVLVAFEKLEAKMRDFGTKFVDIEISTLKYTLSVYYVLASAEASSNLSRFDGIRYGHRTQQAQDLFELYSQTRTEGFGKEVKRRILLGTFALSAGYYDAFYGRALAARDLIVEEFAKVFETIDFIYMPTAPSSAFLLGESSLDPMQEYLNDIFTIPANLAKLPAISLPAPIDDEGLPIGLQFYAPQGNDAQLLALAYDLEKQGLVKTTAFKNMK